MNRAAPITILILTLPAGAHALCTMDTECKGDRICEEGRCVSPRRPTATSRASRPLRAAPRRAVLHPPAVAAAPRRLPRPPAPAARPVLPPDPPASRAEESEPTLPSALRPRASSLSPFFVSPRVVASPPPPAVEPEAPLRWRLPTLALAAPAPRPLAPRVLDGYLDASFLYNASAHGELGYGPRPGLHLAGYRAFRNTFHLGAYFAFTHTTEEVEGLPGVLHALHRNSWSGGVSFKAGGWIGERAWLGFAFDHGVYVFKQKLGGLEGSDLSLWMQAFPRLHLDLLVLRRPVSVGLSVGAGPELLVGERGVGAFTSFTAGLVIGR